MIDSMNLKENVKNAVSLENGREKVVVMRNEKGQLLPGYTPNPYGKPKGTRHMATLLREAVEKISDGEDEPADRMIVEKLIQMAIKGNMRAIDYIFDRIDGKTPSLIKNNYT